MGRVPTFGVVVQQTDSRDSPPDGRAAGERRTAPVPVRARPWLRPQHEARQNQAKAKRLSAVGSNYFSENFVASSGNEGGGK